MRTIEVDGIALSVDDRGDGPALVLLHGFPDLAYSWRHQVPALVDAGYRVITIDQRGYGASDKPLEVDEYRLSKIAGDVVGVLDRFGIDKATVVGHDWGSLVAYTAAVLNPDRIERVVSLNVPYLGMCWGFPTLEVIRTQMAKRFPYIIMFNDGDLAEQGFSDDPKTWLSMFYLGGSRGVEFMTEEELATYVDTFTSGGISGPVNWYRNLDANMAELSSHFNAPITQPTLFIAADSDPVLPLALGTDMGRWVADLDRVVIENCGHWTQQERPDDVNAALVTWLGKQ